MIRSLYAIINKRASAITYAVPSLIFLVLALHMVDLPGLYMDAINPEYMIPEILYSGYPISMKWLMPGNVIFERFPVLSGPMYHGSLQLYATLPFLYMFGVDLDVYRYFQVFVGLSIVILTVIVTKKIGLSNRSTKWIPLVAGILVASDPILIFGLRTQAYSLIFPLPLLLMALIFLDSHLSQQTNSHIKYYFFLLINGFFVGLAVFSYFVYAFFIPVISLFILFHPLDGKGHRLNIKIAIVWIAGIVAGCAGFFAGLALLVNSLGGIKQTIAWWGTISSQLKVLGENQRLLDRFFAIVHDFYSVLNADWIFLTVLKESHGIQLFGLLKLILFPVAVYVAFRVAGSRLFKYLITAILGYLSIAFIFGDRLSGHHYTLLVPLVCVGIAMTLGVFSVEKSKNINVESSRSKVGLFIKLLCIIGVLAIFILNLNLDYRFFARLDATGGVGLYSDAINRFVKEIYKNNKSSMVYFPDWGYRMPFTFLANGSVEYDARIDPAKIKMNSCANRDTFIVFDGEDNYDQFEFIGKLSNVDGFVVTPWRQRDGKVVFEVGRFLARASCEDTSPQKGSLRQMSVTPNASYNCDFLSTVFSAYVSWDFRSAGVEKVSIYVSNGDSKKTLWTHGTAVGGQHTGSWATGGMVFTFFDARNDTQLGSVTIAKLNCPTIEREDRGLWARSRK